MKKLSIIAIAAAAALTLNGCAMFASPESRAVSAIRDTYPALSDASDEKLIGTVKLLCDGMKEDSPNLFELGITMLATQPDGVDSELYSEAIGAGAVQLCPEIKDKLAAFGD